MARRRFFDYKAPDTTKSLNEEKRGILLAGVYFGFNCVPGSSGMQLSLSMDSDPDNTGSKLGSIITRDAVVIQENADLLNVATCGAAHASLTRIDSLVATYVYNAALPNNDVTYQVIAGTAAANPVPPTLNDDQLLLANITIPPLTATLTSAMIADVNRRDIYGQQNLDFTNILRTGVYTGGILSKGSATNRVTLTGLTAITPQMKKVVTSTVADRFTVADCSNDNNNRYDWVVMLHKFEDVENNPPDIIVVQGSQAAEQFASASLPSDGAILAAATAFNPKYNSQTHITKLGYLWVKGTFAGTMSVSYHHTPRLLQNLAFYVSSGQINANGYVSGPNVQPWPFFGVDGLTSALSVLEQIINDMYAANDIAFVNRSPLKLLINGDFRFRSSELIAIPSYVTLEGVGTASIRVLNQHINHPIILGGIVHDGTAVQIRNAVDGVSQTGVPGGFERIEVGLTNALLPFPGVAATRCCGGLAGGDEVILSTTNGSIIRKGWFEKKATTTLSNTSQTFTAIVASGYDKTLTNRVYIMKKRSGIKNVRVQMDGGAPQSGFSCYTQAMAMDSCVMDDYECPSVQWHPFNKNCYVGSLNIRGLCFTQISPPQIQDLIGYGNVYDKIDIVTDIDNANFNNLIGGGLTGSLIQERDAVVGSIQCIKTVTGNVSKFCLGFQNSSIGAVAVRDGYPASAGVRINSYDCQIGSFRVNGVSAPAFPVTQVELTGERNSIASLYADGSVTLVYNNSLNSNGGRNSIGKITGYSISYIDSDDRKNYEVFQALKDRDEDLNLKIFSTAGFTWNSGTGVLSWNAEVQVEMPYNAFNNRILANSVNLNDGDRLVAQLQRDVGSLTTITTSVVTKANAPTIRTGETIVLATRYGTDIYLFDGTRIPTGQTVQLAQGTGNIPDGSITQPKLSADAKAFVNDSFEPWFAVNANVHRDGIAPVAFFSTMKTFGTWSYTPSTGRVSCTGPLPTTWTLDGTDVFIDASGNRHRLLGPQSDFTTTQFFIQKGLGTGTGVGNCDLSTAGANDFNMAKGSGVWYNPSSYTVGPGGVTANDKLGFDITFSSAPPSYLKAGHLFVDGLGNLYPIFAISGNIVRVFGYTTPANAGSTTLRAITDNNPRGLSLMDMKPVMGTEILYFGDSRKLVQFERRTTYKSPVYFEPVPADRRVRFGGNVASFYEAQYTSPIVSIEQSGDAEGLTFSNVGGSTGNGSVEITGWMTGCALILSSAQHITTSFSMAGVIVEVDGVSYSTTSQATQVMDAYSNSSAIHASNWYCRPEMRGLAPGIHTVRLVVPTQCIVLGVVLFNEDDPRSTLSTTPDQALFSEAAGRLYADMTSYDQGIGRTSIPTRSRRGGKAIRYIPTSAPTTRAWALTEFASKTSVGDTSTGSPTITNVGDVSQFAIGDFVRLVYTNGSERRMVTAVGSTSIDVNANPGTAQVAAAIEVCGKSTNSFAIDKPSNMDHPLESEYLVVPLITLASDVMKKNSSNPGTGNANWTHYRTAASIGPRKVNFPDNAGYASGNNLRFPVDDSGVDMSDSASRIRIAFVGSGIDLIWKNLDSLNEPSWTMNVRLDGIDLGSMSFSPNYGNASNTTVPRRGWQPGLGVGFGNNHLVTPMMQQLDYGFHVLELSYNATTPITTNTLLAAVSLWEPASPSYSGYPIWEGCFTGESPRTSGGNLLDDSTGKLSGFFDCPSGFIEYDPTLVLGIKRVSSLSNVNRSPTVPSTAANNAFSRGHALIWNTMQAADADIMYCTFYGSAIGFDMWKENANAVTYGITVLDADGTYRAPASLTGTYGTPAVTGGADSAALSNGGTTGTSRDRIFVDLKFVKVWTVKLTFNNTTAGTNAYVGSVFIKSPLHLNQRKHMIDNCSFLVPRSSGRDRRTIKAYDVEEVNPVKSSRLVWRNDDLTSFSAFLYPTDAGRMILYSEGAYYTIRLDASFVGSVSTGNCCATLTAKTIKPDRNIGGTSGNYEMWKAKALWNASVNTGAASAGTAHTHPVNDRGLATARQIGCELNVFLPPGLHRIDLTVHNDANDPPANADYDASSLFARYTISATPSGRRGTQATRRREATPRWIRNGIVDGI